MLSDQIEKSNGDWIMKHQKCIYIIFAALVATGDTQAQGIDYRSLDDGEAGYKLGCLAMGLAGQHGLTNTRACGEIPYNAQVNRMIDLRISDREHINMNGQGVLLPSPPPKDLFGDIFPAE